MFDKAQAIWRRQRPFGRARSGLSTRPACVLVLQSDGEHKGQDGWTPNAYLRECHALQYGFERNGIAADVWGPRHDNYAHRPDFESYDLLLCAENYGLEWLPDLSAVRRPLKLHWIIDLHCQPASVYDRLTRGCDVVLHATRRLMGGYETLHPDRRHLWFPNAVDDRYFDAMKQRRDKSRDVIFVGSNLPERRAFVRALKQRVGLKSVFATGADMLDLIGSARIQVNSNLGADINYRTFETIGLGTCLVTNEDPDLQALGFEDGVNCLLYRSEDEAAEKIQAALADGSWEPIGAAGYELSRRHTYTRRINTLLTELVLAG